MGDERRYTDEQAAAILARAADLSVQQQRASSAGLTLADLEKAAQDAGLDPALVRAAARDVARGTARPTTKAQRWFGPTRLSYEADVDGEIDDEARQAIVEAIQRSLPALGQVSNIGRLTTFTVSDPQTGRRLQISVVGDRGRTRVSVDERLGGLMGGIYGGVGGGVGSIVPIAIVGAAVAAGPIAAIAAGVAAAAAVFGGTRALYITVADRRRAQTERVFDEVRAIVEERARRPESALAEARARHGVADAAERQVAAVVEEEARARR